MTRLLFCGDAKIPTPYFFVSTAKAISLPVLAAALILLAYIVGQTSVKATYSPDQSVWITQGTWAFPGVLSFGAVLTYALYKTHMPRTRDRSSAIQTFLLGVATFTMLIAVSFLFTHLSGGNLSLESTTLIKTSVPEILGIALFIPFIEEVAFRAWLVSFLIRRCSATTSVVGSTMLFAIFHFSFDLFDLATFFALGFILSLFWIRTRSLAACFLVHGSYNLCAYLIN